VKRLPILFLLILCLSITLSASNAGSVIDDVLIIPKVEFGATIDGEVESDWDFPPVCMYVYSSNNDPAVPVGGALDLSAWYKVAWNDDGIYFFGHVTDDSVVAHSDPTTAQHVTDSWEIFIDGENEDAGSYDDNDAQFRWAYDLAEEINYGDLPNEEVAWVEADDGYDFEVFLPASDLADSHSITLADDKVIGWETQVNDIEVEGTRQNQVKWWEADDASWSNPGLFGTAMLSSNDDGTLLIPQVEFDIVVDATLDEDWNDVDGKPVPKVGMYVYSTNNTPSAADGGGADLSAYYYAAWSDNGISFFGHVTDDSVVAHSDPTTAQHVTDSWEIFIDGENEDAGSYDDNDVQFRWAYDLAEEINYGDLPNEEVAWAEVDDGYDFEVFIPASDLADSHSITLELDKVIGWETQVNDIDVEGARQNQIKWWEGDDASWSNPGLFGTAMLSQTSGIEEETASADIALSAPVILGAGATVSYEINARSSVSLALVNVAGQVVKVLDAGVKSAGAHSASIDADGLANGVYLVTLDACGTVAAAKTLVIK
jgi:hypothetical protein